MSLYVNFRNFKYLGITYIEHRNALWHEIEKSNCSKLKKVIYIIKQLGSDILIRLLYLALVKSQIIYNIIYWNRAYDNILTQREVYKNIFFRVPTKKNC